MAAELRTGEVLGRFELLTQLGRGGMASVWVARERSGSGKQRLIAVKAMLPELASRADFRGMFLEEGQIVRSIEHKNVVQVFEVSEDRGVLYMAMEWVEGDSLRAVIREAKRRRAIPPEMAVRMIADTAGGLHAAHEVRDWDGSLRGIVHCDISPHNILIGLDGNAKLVDFGVANATQRSQVGDKDQIKGKFGYMSPEQARAKKLDRRSDVFSLGIVLFELTTGERLFKGDTPKDTLQRVASGKIPRPTEVYAKYPPRLEEIVLKALARNVEERYQTAAEFKEALERYLIAERILISRASVAQLLKRVLGARLEQQRGAIRDALKSIDGDSAAALVPTESTVPLSELIGSSEASFTGASSPSSATASQSGLSSPRQSVTASDPPSITTHSHFSQNSHTTQPQLMDSSPRPTRSTAPLAFGLAAMVVALSAAVVWVVKYRVPAIAQPVIVTHQSAADRQPASNGATEPVQGSGAVDLNTLPESGDAGARAGGAPAQAQARAPGRASGKSDKAKGDKVVLSEAKGSDAPAPPASAAPVAPPLPTEPQAPAAPPMSQRGPLNRGAAIAAVSKVMFSAASCKQGGGPTGSGRAQVTFSPEGRVSAVSISAPFGGTGVGNCVAGQYRALSIPAFQGSAVTLPGSFRIPD